ncbi:MAG TPA: hypothetical protein VGC34_14920, partial [Steroidobacteraceae bacterium]
MGSRGTGKPGADSGATKQISREQARVVRASSQRQNRQLDMGSTSTAAARLPHDFSRIPLHAPVTGVIQTKLAVNTPGDIYEQEADTA